MPNAKEAMRECNDISQALSSWLESQQVGPDMAVMAMSYLIGAMAIAGVKDVKVISSRLNSAQKVQNLVALLGFLETADSKEQNL